MYSIPSSSVTHPTTSSWKISWGFSLITNDGRGLQLLHDVLQRLHGRMLMGEPLLLMGQVVSSLKTRRGGREKTYQKQQASSWGRLFLSTRFNWCRRKTRFNSSWVWLVEGRSMESKIEWDDTKEELGRGDGGARGGRRGGWHVYFGQNRWTTSVLVHLLEGLFS